MMVTGLLIYKGILIRQALVTLLGLLNTEDGKKHIILLKSLSFIYIPATKKVQRPYINLLMGIIIK